MSYDSDCYCVDGGEETCVFCEMETISRLGNLVKNLVIAGALCETFWCGDAYGSDRVTHEDYFNARGNFVPGWAL